MKETYYFPVYCYRHFPSLGDGIDEIIRQLAEGRWLTVYTNIEDAEDAGNRLLCDDDCIGVMRLDFCDGMAELLFASDGTSLRLPALSKNHLKIISNIKMPKYAKYGSIDSKKEYSTISVNFDTDLVTLHEKDSADRVYLTVDVDLVEFDFNDFTEEDRDLFLNRFERYKTFED